MARPRSRHFPQERGTFVGNILEYKCPCCGGAIAFDSGLQKMKCPYCDTEFEMATLQAYDADLNQDKPDDIQWNDTPDSTYSTAEAEGMVSYVCNSCGGEIIGDVNTAATSCPFCGNPVVVMGKLSGQLKPDLVIPFKLDKNAAKAAMEKHLLGKRLLPKVFKSQQHIDEIRGIYVPFWLFDAEADAHIRYKATRTRTWSDSNYNYTETSFYSVTRDGGIAFAGIPVDGSSKMPDDLMESLEPFDLNQAVDFQTAYLAGYFADKYDVDAAHSVDRANQRVKRSTEDAFRSTVTGYATVRAESSSVNTLRGRNRYALLPVWLLNTTWNGQKYVFAMNGQTGKFVGDLPVDKGAYWRWFFGVFAAVAAGIGGLSALLYFLG